MCSVDVAAVSPALAPLDGLVESFDQLAREDPLEMPSSLLGEQIAACSCCAAGWTPRSPGESRSSIAPGASRPSTPTPPAPGIAMDLQWPGLVAGEDGELAAARGLLEESVELRWDDRKGRNSSRRACGTRPWAPRACPGRCSPCGARGP